jgi:succinate-semialdehyde dehydrogenase/glutarate-semialdehyde dehydrogenase
MKSTIKELKKNQNEWSEKDIDSRINIIKEFYDVILKNKLKIADSITKDINKPISQSLAEIDFNLEIFNWYFNNVKTAISDKVIHENENQISKIYYVPKGIYAVILPWNFPFGIFISGVIPALLVGNTVVVKFSEYNNNYSKIMGEILSETLELSKYLKLTYGDKTLGEELISQDIDGVWFTGSRMVGTIISNNLLSRNIIPNLELGGSNPAIIFEDSNIDKIIDKIYFERFFNNGQYCDAIKRVIIHSNILDLFIEKMTKYINNKIIDSPFNKTTELGPLANKVFLQKIKNQYKDALQKGAVEHKINTNYNDKLFFKPVLLSSVDETMKVWNEEVFGPILPIMTFNNTEEAISLANSTKFDLGANIFTKDKELASYVASKLNAGNIEINNTNHWDPNIPFGGLRYSGNSKEYGEQGFQEFCYSKIVCSPKK